jgi:hypothetical protein
MEVDLQGVTITQVQLLLYRYKEEVQVAMVEMTCFPWRLPF